MPPVTLSAGLRLSLVALHLLHGAVQAGLLFRVVDLRWRQRLQRRWSRQLLALLGIRIDAAGELTGIESGLLVGNHISFLDILVINAVLPAAFVAKSDVAQWPLVGWLARRADTVFIQRGSRTAAQATCRQMHAALAAGRRVAIFPEGTTSLGDRVLPFHAALFQSAIDAEVPVHALALSYHDHDGSRSTAPAYIDDTSLLDCLISILRSDGLVARMDLAASFPTPLPERRHLAHHARHAIAAALADDDAVMTSRHRQSLEQKGKVLVVARATSP